MSEKVKDGINEGTKVKSILQQRAIEFLKGYPPNKTLDSYARLLCWDLNTTFRTALESYILPLYEHGFFIYLGNDKFSFTPDRKNSNNKMEIKKIKVKNKKNEENTSFVDYAKNNPNQIEKNLGENKN